jgi:hypothetical protein
MNACLLIYDIPDTAVLPNGQPYPNPSPRLRRRCIRVNLSCWVVMEGDIPYYLLNEMTAAGCTWHVVKFDAGEGEKLVSMCIQALKAEIQTALGNARNARNRLDGRLDRTADETLSREEITRRYRTYRRQAKQLQKRLETLLKSVGEAVQRFGIDPAAVGIGAAHEATQAIRLGMTRKAQIFAETADLLTRINTRDSRVIGRQMANNDDSYLLALIAADYAEENGYATEGQTLRDAFR